MLPHEIVTVLDMDRAEDGIDYVDFNPVITLDAKTYLRNNIEEYRDLVQEWENKGKFLHHIEDFHRIIDAVEEWNEMYFRLSETELRQSLVDDDLYAQKYIMESEGIDHTS